MRCASITPEIGVSGQDHLDVVGLIESVQDFPEASRHAFVAHFRSLASVKSVVQYSGDEFDAHAASTGIKHMERCLDAVRLLAKRFGWG